MSPIQPTKFLHNWWIVLPHKSLYNYPKKPPCAAQDSPRHYISRVMRPDVRACNPRQ